MAIIAEMSFIQGWPLSEVPLYYNVPDGISNSQNFGCASGLL